MNQIKLLEKTWKSAFVALSVLTLSVGGLFVNLTSASAIGSPNLTVRTLVSEIEDPSQGWTSNLNTQAGRTVVFYVEIHNTQVQSRADEVTAKVNFPTGTSTTHNIPVTITSTTASSVSSSVNVNIVNPANGGTIQYLPGSSRLTWDFNGDGIREYDMTPIPDGVATSGVNIGDQSGCNEFIIQLNFAATISGTAPVPSPTPTPTPTPVASPTPIASPSPVATPPSINITNTNTNTNTQNQTNNQTVNVTTPAVAGIKTTPETGVGVLGMTGMFGSMPIGYMLAKYGKGRLTSKKEEDLTEIANDIFASRLGNKA